MFLLLNIRGEVYKYKNQNDQLISFLFMLFCVKVNCSLTITELVKVCYANTASVSTAINLISKASLATSFPAVIVITHLFKEGVCLTYPHAYYAAIL